MDEQPPEDSIFANPIWNKGFNDPNASQVQMDPAMAMQQSQIKSTVFSVVRGVSIAVLALAVVVGGVGFMLTQTKSTQASIDLKHAILGTVKTVNSDANTFTIGNTSSQDPAIVDTGITAWTIQLPPGSYFSRKADAAISTCYTITNLNRNLTEAVPTSCVNFLFPENRVVIEYLIVKADTSTIITKKIIKEE